MKLTFSSLACMDWSSERLVEACKKLNMEGLEYRLPPDIDSFLESGEADLLKKAAEESGIKIIDIGTSVLLHKYDPEKILMLEKCINIAKELNADGIRVFLGNFLARRSNKGEGIDYSGLVRLLKEVCVRAAEAGSEIWVETHNEFSTGKVLKKLLDDVSEKNLKIIWDIIHPIEEGENYIDTMEYLGDKIAHLHIKDGKKQQDEDLIDYLYTKLGEGELPVREIVRHCCEKGFDGYYSLEWEPLWKKEIQGYDVMEILEHYVSYINN